MELGITIPLQKQLKLPAPGYGSEEELAFCWDLHGIILQGEKALAAVNASSCYSVVLCGLDRGDWEHYPQLITGAIRTGLLSDGYSEQEVNAYFRKAGAVTVTKTHGRRPVAGLNRIMDFLWAAPVVIDRQEQYQKAHCRFVNTSLMRAAGFEGYGQPMEFLERDMERLKLI